ncbi:tetratricopeptide repeat protein [Streptomyces netropsis]
MRPAPSSPTPSCWNTCCGSWARTTPDTLAARHNLAYWRGEAGDAAGAAAAYTELLEHMLRVLGPDHPDTLVVRGSLARWRGEAGDATGAVTAYTELLEHKLRVLYLEPPRHPQRPPQSRLLASTGRGCRWRRRRFRAAAGRQGTCAR